MKNKKHARKIKKLKKYSFYVFNKFQAILIIGMYLLFVVLLFAIGIGGYFFANYLIDKILKMSFSDTTLMSIVITILFALIAIDTTITTLTYSKKDSYYMGILINRNPYFNKIRKIWNGIVVFLFIDFVINIFAVNLSRLTSASIVLSLFFVIKIFCQVWANRQSEAKLYYNTAIKSKFLSLPFTNQSNVQVIKFYDGLLRDDRDREEGKIPSILNDLRYDYVDILCEVLKFVRDEKAPDKLHSYIDLFSFILNDFSNKQKFENALFQSLILQKDLVYTLGALPSSVYVIKLFKMWNECRLKVEQTSLEQYENKVLKFLVKKEIKKGEYSQQLNVIHMRFESIRTLAENLNNQNNVILEALEKKEDKISYLNDIKGIKSTFTIIKTLEDQFKTNTEKLKEYLLEKATRD